MCSSGTIAGVWRRTKRKQEEPKEKGRLISDLVPKQTQIWQELLVVSALKTKLTKSNYNMNTGVLVDVYDCTFKGQKSVTG